MKRTMWGVVAGAALTAVGGCGGDKIAESIAERQIESGTGGDAEIDLSDGNFRVETEDGSVEFVTDEDGNATIKIEDAEGNEVGDATITNDGDGDISIESSEGDAQLSGDDGEVKIETDDGSATLSSDGEIPDGFPDLPFPDDMDVMMSQQANTDEGATYVLISAAPGDWESYLDELTSFFDDNGYTQQSMTTTPDGAFFIYLDPSETTLISGGVSPEPSSGGMSLNLAVGPN